MPNTCVRNGANVMPVSEWARDVSDILAVTLEQPCLIAERIAVTRWHVIRVRRHVNYNTSSWHLDQVPSQ